MVLYIALALIIILCFPNIEWIWFPVYSAICIYIRLQVKDDAKTIFGERLHVDEEEIIHVDYGEKYDDPKSGLL